MKPWTKSSKHKQWKQTESKVQEELVKLEAKMEKKVDEQMTIQNAQTQGLITKNK